MFNVERERAAATVNIGATHYEQRTTHNAQHTTHNAQRTNDEHAPSIPNPKQTGPNRGVPGRV